jgi:hypothetical protein
MEMGLRRVNRAIPTITDSFLLAFVFFALSDLHQILRQPTIENLLRVLTTLQLTANSPFDYPAFLFMGLFTINLVALLVARIRPAGEPVLRLQSIPLERGPLTAEEVGGDVLRLAGLVRGRAREAGIGSTVSMKTIEGTIGRVSLTSGEISRLREAVGIVSPGSAVDVSLRGSPLTSLLLRASSRLGLPIGGIYHPLQNAMSLNPRFSALTQAYVYVHETFHSLGFGEVLSEVGTIEVLIRLGRLEDLPLSLLGHYLLFRSAAGYLEEIGGTGDIEGKLTGLSYGWTGMGSSVLRARKADVERGIYRLLKSSPNLNPAPAS